MLPAFFPPAGVIVVKKFMIGCGLVLVVLLGIGVFGAVQLKNWLQDTVPHLEQMEARRTALVDAYGPATAYVPPTTDAYDPARVATYLDIRDALRDERSALTTRVEELIAWSLEEGNSGFLESMSHFGGAVKIFASLTRYSSSTDSMLLEREMGLGEFTHLHSTLFWGWMDLESERRQWREMIEAAPADNDMVETLAELQNSAETRSSEILRAHLGNLIEAVGDSPTDSVAAHLAVIRSGNPDLPFADPLPSSLERAFDAEAVRIRSSAPKSLGAWLAEMASLIDFDDNPDREGISREITVGF